ncbi:response regulator [Aquiflexum sp. LQ15W]|jgi:CheY-like chemotaxis protein|uniref:response regulator n=1 Tax=Cognataquiflexum nitidum TaxID=2922272 RepID=UPI001F1412ED|nr:response regulator [Cognataquiflexum nitidum]MCH6198045.1 response regulator [Cognataquiflexum nitidum]
MEIIIVDDEAVFLMIHENILKRHGVIFPIRSFLWGTELISFLKNNNSEDKKFLILLDIYMDNMDAWEILAYLDARDFKCKFKVVIVTSSVEIEEREKSKKFHFVVDFINKPLNRDLVEQIMERAHFE